MLGRQHTDLRSLGRNRRAERVLDVALAAAIGIALAVVLVIQLS